MQLDEKKRIIEETTKELLEKMGFKATIYTETTVTETEENTPISVEIQLTDSKYLIGKHGLNLSALQHLLRIIIRKKASQRIDFNVDINGYREGQKQSIIDLAHEVAEKVSREKKVVILRPMNAYERRLVHVELDQNKNVKTESIGEKDERKVAVKPVSIEDELDL